MCYHKLKTQIAEKSQINIFFPLHSKKEVDKLRLGRRKKENVSNQVQDTGNVSTGLLNLCSKQNKEANPSKIRNGK